MLYCAYKTPLLEKNDPEKTMPPNNLRIGLLKGMTGQLKSYLDIWRGFINAAAAN